MGADGAQHIYPLPAARKRGAQEHLPDGVQVVNGKKTSNHDTIPKISSLLALSISETGTREKIPKNSSTSVEFLAALVPDRRTSTASVYNQKNSFHSFFSPPLLPKATFPDRGKKWRSTTV